MNFISLSEFQEDIQGVIDVTLEVEEQTQISTEKGNVILMAESTYGALMEIVANRKCVY